MIPIKDYPGPRRRMPWVTWGLIAVNIAVFLYQVSLGSNAPAFMFAYSVVPLAVTHGIAQIAVGPDSSIPSLGASGAIAGVLAAYLVLFPLAGVRTLIFTFIFFTIVTVPAFVLIGIWFLLQFFDGVASLANVQQGMG